MQNIFLTVGPPGTGKTTRLADKVSEAADLWGGDKVMVCSLTRTAAAEVRRRGIPLPHSSVGTMHAHCYRALGRPEIAESHIAEFNDKYGENVTQTKSLPEDAVSDPLPDTNGSDRSFGHYTRLRAQMVDRAEWPLTTQEFADRWEEFKARTGYFDFEDLIERCRVDFERPPGNPYAIYVDEAQDCSASEVALAKKWAEHSRVIFYGDLDQTIFQFRGATPRAFYDLNIPPQNRLVLEQSHRVPRAVLERSLNWIGRVQEREPVTYRPRDAEGELRLAPIPFRAPWLLMQDAEQYLSQGKTVMFLASCGYHLDPLVQHLRKEGVPFHNPYRMDNGRWNPLGARGGTSSVDRMLAYLSARHTGRWTLQALAAWLELISADVLTRGAKKKISDLADAEGEPGGPRPVLDDAEVEALFDSPDICAAALSHAWQGSPAWLEQHLLKSKEKVLEYPLRVYGQHGEPGLKERPRVVVGTVHSVKGGQADVVYLCPSMSRAGFENWIGSPSQRDEVYRLFYVGMTRAFETLVLCEDVGMLRVGWN